MKHTTTREELLLAVSNAYDQGFWEVWSAGFPVGVTMRGRVIGPAAWSFAMVARDHLKLPLEVALDRALTVDLEYLDHCMTFAEDEPAQRRYGVPLAT
jgi:hypothetical protein